MRVPHYILNALDDPFIDRDSLPTEADVGAGAVRLRYTRHGGHCGYLLGMRSLSVCWRALFSKILQGKRVEAAAAAPNGYLPEELARFLVHVDHSTGGRAPERGSPAALKRAGGPGNAGLISGFLAVLACLGKYVAVLFPRLARKVQKP